MLNIELRNPEDVMKLSRLGSFHQSKLSFLRSFIREFKNWEFNRDIFDLDKSGYDYSYLLRSNCEMEYPYFIFFTWAVLKQDTYQAIRRYSNFRSYAKELMDFEEDIFNLLPIENIEGLYESIKLIDFTLGIVKKKGN